MDAPRLARAWFGLTALAVIVGLVTQMIALTDPDEGRFATTGQRIANMFAFFTVQSNILVAVTTGALALGLAGSGTLFRVLRLTALVAISVTGVVYHIALSQLRELDGYGLLADQLLHTVVPLLAVAGWLLFGPRGETSWRVVARTAVFPLAWGAFTLVRGPIPDPDWYPYPFVDVVEEGYLRVFVNMAVIGALFTGLAAGAHRVDSRLPGVRRDELSRRSPRG